MSYTALSASLCSVTEIVAIKAGFGVCILLSGPLMVLVKLFILLGGLCLNLEARRNLRERPQRQSKMKATAPGSQELLPSPGSYNTDLDSWSVTQ